MPLAVRKEFVLSDEKVPGKCCLKEEPVACRVGNKIYQVQGCYIVEKMPIHEHHLLYKAAIKYVGENVYV